MRAYLGFYIGNTSFTRKPLIFIYSLVFHNMQVPHFHQLLLSFIYICEFINHLAEGKKYYMWHIYTSHQSQVQFFFLINLNMSYGTKLLIQLKKKTIYWNWNFVAICNETLLGQALNQGGNFAVEQVARFSQLSWFHFTCRMAGDWCYWVYEPN